MKFFNTLSQEKEELETQAAARDQKNEQTIDELLGKDRVLQYQNETLTADNAQKEKKIEELEGKIEKQAAKEESLMSLIEETEYSVSRDVATSQPIDIETK